MDGVFGKRKFTMVYNLIGLVSGVFLILMFGFFVCTGEYVTLDDQIASLFFVSFGCFASILCGVSLYVNRKAYIHVDEHGVSAFCHFGLSLECSFSDVSSVSYGGTGLNIQLKNGKKYSLMNLENAYQLGKYIQKRMPRKSMMIPDRNQLMTEILLLRKKRKYEGIGSICCFLLLIPGILLTTGLTGWKDLQDFDSTDWTIFAVMAGFGVITVVMACILFRRFLLDTDKLHMIHDTLYQTLLRTSPIGPGNALRLFLDDDVNASIRLIVYGFPNSKEVYFAVEQINQNYEIDRIHESKIYSSMDALAPEIEGMTEIPLP